MESILERIDQAAAVLAAARENAEALAGDIDGEQAQYLLRGVYEWLLAAESWARSAEQEVWAVKVDVAVGLAVAAVSGVGSEPAEEVVNADAAAV